MCALMQMVIRLCPLVLCASDDVGDICPVFDGQQAYHKPVCCFSEVSSGRQHLLNS